MATLTLAKTRAFREDWLKFVFHGLQPPCLVLASGSWPPVGAITSLYVSFHTASPGEGGSQSTNEATFGGYGRVAVARSVAGWTIDEPATGDWRARNAVIIEGTDRTDVGSQALTHYGIGSAASGAGTLLYSGPLPSTLTITQGTRPRIGVLGLTIKEQ